MTRFQQALLDELTNRVGSPTPAAVSRRRPLLLAGAAGAALAALGVVAAGSAHDTTAKAGLAAYTVTTEKHQLRVSVNYLGDPAEVNRKLAKEGLRIRLIPIRPGATCADPGRPTVTGTPAFGVSIRVGTGSATITNPDAIPAGDVLLLSPYLEARSMPVRWRFGFVGAPAPNCTALPPPPGFADPHASAISGPTPTAGGR